MWCILSRACLLWMWVLALGAGLRAQHVMVRDPLPVPDIPGYRTLKGDFHTHTVFSDGELWPTLRAWEAWRDGLDVLAMTDHADSQPHAPDVVSDLARPYALARDLASQLGLILIQGIELGHGDSHWNALFVTDPNALRGKLELSEALRRARVQGAFVFWNHPGWQGKLAWAPGIDSMHRQGLFQGIELVNGDTVYPEAFPWHEEKGLTLLANSDVHRTSVTRKRTITLLFVHSPDADGVREALFAGRTAAWVGGEVYGSEEYLRGLWQEAVKAETRDLTWNLEGRHPNLLLRNHSAVPFRFKVLRVSARNSEQENEGWFQSYPGELPAESVAPLQIGVSREAPLGWSNAELELEVTNLHTGPGKNLVVRLPIRINLKREGR
ncbi:MAG: hypothetical protein AB1898_22445 [Acidobacteriota bacterium]